MKMKNNIINIKKRMLYIIDNNYIQQENAVVLVIKETDIEGIKEKIANLKINKKRTILIINVINHNSISKLLSSTKTCADMIIFKMCNVDVEKLLSSSYLKNKISKCEILCLN